MRRQKEEAIEMQVVGIGLEIAIPGRSARSRYPLAHFTQLP